MSISSSPSQRFVSFSAMRASSTPRMDMPRYVSPTYRSSVFSHLKEEREESPSTETSQTFRSFRQGSEDFTLFARKAGYVPRNSQVLPSVAEWTPQRHHINDPEFFNKIEEEAVAHAKAKEEQIKAEQREKKERLNREYKEAQSFLEKKHANRLDNKKPSQTDLRSFKDEEETQINAFLAKQKQLMEEKNDYLKSLDHQINEKVKQRQIEIQNQRNDTRTGLDFKPRQQYDMEEYKRILQKQIEEKQQQKLQREQAREQEKTQRLKAIQEEDSFWGTYKQKLALRKAQNEEGLAEQVKEQTPLNGRRPTEEVSEIDLFKGEKIDRRSSTGVASTKRISFGRIEEEVNSPQKRMSLQSAGTASKRFISPVKNETASEPKSDWEVASALLLQKKEQQEQYLRELKEQILLRKQAKESEKMKHKEEEMRVSGLKLGGYKPKETVTQVKDILKKQMNDKEEVRKSEVKAKKAEMQKIKETQKADESVMMKKYEEICQQKIQSLSNFKKAIMNSAPVKKAKGLTTVKI